MITADDLINAQIKQECDEIDFCQQAAPKQKTWCMQRTSVVSSTTFNFNAYKVEKSNKIYLPEVSGHGFDDAWGAFVIQPFGEIEIETSLCRATVAYVKRYSSGWEFRVVETLPYPIPDEYYSIIKFKASNNRPPELAETGSYKMHSSRRCGNFVENAQLGLYFSGTDHDGDKIMKIQYENFVAIPRVSGTGKDDIGRFWLDSQTDTIIEGRIAILNYVRRYNNGMEIKIKEKIAWPLTNFVTLGTYTKTNKASQRQSRGFHTLVSAPQVDNGLVTMEKKRMLQATLGSKLVVFTESSYVQHPSVNGVGTSSLGDYKVVQLDCELNAERFIFDWGYCDFRYTIPAGSGMQTFGTVTYNCFSISSDQGVHASGQSDFCSMVHSNPHLNHCFVEPTMLTLQINDPANKPHKLRIDNFVLYPQASGSGYSDCRGNFQLVGVSLTAKHRLNKWILKYEDGEEVQLKFYFTIRNDGSMTMTGRYHTDIVGKFDASGGLGDVFKRKIKDNCVIPPPKPINDCPLQACLKHGLLCADSFLVLATFSQVLDNWLLDYN